MIAVVVAQTIKGGAPAGVGAGAGGSLLTQPVVVLLVAGLMTLTVWVLTARSARRMLAASRSTEVGQVGDHRRPARYGRPVDPHGAAAGPEVRREPESAAVSDS